MNIKKPIKKENRITDCLHNYNNEMVYSSTSYAPYFLRDVENKNNKREYYN